MVRWHYEDADPDETQWYTVLDTPASLGVGRQLRRRRGDPSVELDDGRARAARWAFIDLDPGERTAWDDLVLLAGLHRTALDHLAVRGMPKVTGKRGIQIWIPVGPGYTFGETRAWVERLSRMIGQTVPELVSWEWQKARRDGLARLDYTQNAMNKTLVVPFGARPRPGAPVSVPIEWAELDDPELRPDRWTIRTRPRPSSRPPATRCDRSSVSISGSRSSEGHHRSRARWSRIAATVAAELLVVTSTARSAASA